MPADFPILYYLTKKLIACGLTDEPSRDYRI
jgi:hypothetical protein